jgi:predicted dehydrogenase
MPAKVKLGLIGCGGIMSMHVNQLEPVRSAEIVGLADPEAKMLDRLVQRHPRLEGRPRFADYEEMLEAVPMDGVIIASPHVFHYEQIMTSLDRGLHVLTEKPMVCSVAHAKSVMRKSQRRKRVLMIAYQRHFSPASRYARELVASGKIGRVTFIQALQAQEWLRGTRGTWRQDPEISCGGQLNDSGSHLLDIILWVTGLTPDSVCAAIDERGSGVDINSGLTVRFKEGATASIAVVGDAPGWWEDVTYYCERGAIYIRDGRITLQTQASKRWGKTKSQDVTERRRYKGNADKNFVDSILGRDEPQTPPICGLRVIQLTQAAWESARAGEPVKVRR